MATVRISRALVSVSDKSGLAELGRGLARHSVEILSTGGTAKALREAGVAVREVSDFTGAPEILDGRVKTLHPRVHGGILGRNTSAHREEMRRAGIDPIDLVVVNLYPFRETVARGGTFDEVIENIDIGGPAMIRSAAKNHERVAVIVEPADYGRVLGELDAAGEISAPLRYELARKAFAHTAAYDGAIAGHLGRLSAPNASASVWTDTLHVGFRLQYPLRYGENPHQKAAFYADAEAEDAPAADAGEGDPGPSLARAKVLQGKELSYNNILDLDAALRLCGELSGSAVVIVKHTNPCGAAVSARGVADAYRRARETDPVSAFGGIVAVNREVDAELGRELSETFLECVIAPAYAPEALAALGAKKNLRVLAGDVRPGSAAQIDLRSVAGGILVQTRDAVAAGAAAGRVVSKRAPTAAEIEDLDFAWRVAKHVKSNAIVLAGGGRTLGVGAGQMSRVDSVRIAVSKARASLRGAVMASDAFFPFRDGIDEAAKTGVAAVIHPGGSMRDDEVLAAADEHGMALIVTGERHFRH